jgi:hypothetical protein
MKEKVAVATVQGKPYFLIVNKLNEKNVSFISLLPGQSVPAKIKFKKTLLGKKAFSKIVIGIDPGVATGLVAVADGKVIEEGNCFSSEEVISSIIKILGNVDFAVTTVSGKIEKGVPIYKELFRDLDDALPPQIALEVVDEAGTHKPLKENKRSGGVRHISSAIRITGRAGNIFPRRKTIAAHSRIQ